MEWESYSLKGTVVEGSECTYSGSLAVEMKMGFHGIICKQPWPYVTVLYKYFTLTDKAMYLLQGRVPIKPLNVTTN